MLIRIFNQRNLCTCFLMEDVRNLGMAQALFTTSCCAVGSSTKLFFCNTSLPSIYIAPVSINWIQFFFSSYDTAHTVAARILSLSLQFLFLNPWSDAIHNVLPNGRPQWCVFLFYNRIKQGRLSVFPRIFWWVNRRVHKNVPRL